MKGLIFISVVFLILVFLIIVAIKHTRYSNERIDKLRKLGEIWEQNNKQL